MSEPVHKTEIKPAPRHRWLRKELGLGVIVILAVAAAVTFSMQHRVHNAPGAPVGQLPVVKPLQDR